MRIEIPVIPPSLNVQLRMHWATRRRLNDNWDTWVWAHLRGYKHGNRKQRVTITIHRQRLLDKDNAYGACKPCVDALKGFYIVDDTAEWLDLHVEQQKCARKDVRTVIEIEPAATTVGEKEEG